MFCLLCNHDLITCTCPDIEERLASLAGTNAAPAAAQNLATRRKAREQIAEATKGQRPA